MVREKDIIRVAIKRTICFNGPQEASTKSFTAHLLVAPPCVVLVVFPEDERWRREPSLNKGRRGPKNPSIISEENTIETR